MAKQPGLDFQSAKGGLGELETQTAVCYRCADCVPYWLFYSDPWY